MSDAIPQKKGGKRSVTHLNAAQLKRKRANDREAQRNIRQRTKEHIENLEKRVKELESGSRSSNEADFEKIQSQLLQRNQELEAVEKIRSQLLQRNQELEAEVENIRSQLFSTIIPPTQVQTEHYTQPGYQQSAVYDINPLIHGVHEDMTEIPHAYAPNAMRIETAEVLSDMRRGHNMQQQPPQTFLEQSILWDQQVRTSFAQMRISNNPPHTPTENSSVRMFDKLTTGQVFYFDKETPLTPTQANTSFQEMAYDA